MLPLHFCSRVLSSVTLRAPKEAHQITHGQGAQATELSNTEAGAYPETHTHTQTYPCTLAYFYLLVNNSPPSHDANVIEHTHSQTYSCTLTYFSEVGEGSSQHSQGGGLAAKRLAHSHEAVAHNDHFVQLGGLQGKSCRVACVCMCMCVYVCVCLCRAS